jgi:hypothetical protein
LISDAAWLRAIADSIGFADVFPYMGFAFRPHARISGAREFNPTNVARS